MQAAAGLPRTPRPLDKTRTGRIDIAANQGRPMSPRDLTIPGERHPEKAHRPDNAQPKKPDWIRVKAPTSRGLQGDARHHARAEARHRLRRGGLPQRRRMLVAGPRHHDDHGRDLHARLHLLQRRHRQAPRRSTPSSRAASPMRWPKLGLKHVVITSVDRDDLDDGGAEHFAQTIRAIRHRAPDTTIEILTPDFLKCAPRRAGNGRRGAPRRLQPQPRNRAGPLPRGAPRRALLPLAAPAAAGEGARPGDVHQVRASWWAWARTASRCCR